MNFDQYIKDKKIPVAKIHPWFLNVPSQYPITLADGTKIVISNVTDLTVDMDIWGEKLPEEEKWHLSEAPVNMKNHYAEWGTREHIKSRSYIMLPLPEVRDFINQRGGIQV